MEILRGLASETIVLAAVAVHPTDSYTGKLPEQGSLIQDVWRRVLQTVPSASGCRLLWNTLFFAWPETDVDVVGHQLGEILRSEARPGLLTLCVISEAPGPENEQIGLLDEMLGEISTPRNFGSDQRFTRRLLNGNEWSRPDLPPEIRAT